jgi:hypothetical protein
MRINYENYNVFLWTDKQLKKHYSKEILDKYYKQLAFLFQNGYNMEECETINEIEEQLEMWNYFKNYEDFEDMKGLYNIESDYSVGRKIFSEELYDIIKFATFSRKEADNPILIKGYANTYWNKIGEALNRLDNLFESDDIEIKGVVKELSNQNNIRERLDELFDKYEEEKKILTWIKFAELNNIIYSTYIKLTKLKTDSINVSKASNLNDELYGGIGGFNPNTGEIKCIIGSAVWQLKTIKSTKSIVKIKTVAGYIFENKPIVEDDEGIKYLDKWFKGIEKDDEKARQVVVCSLLHGIITLLCLKHNLNFLKDNKNSKRAEAIYYELGKIMEYCEISKDYLL